VIIRNLSLELSVVRSNSVINKGISLVIPYLQTRTVGSPDAGHLKGIQHLEVVDSAAILFGVVHLVEQRLRTDCVPHHDFMM